MNDKCFYSKQVKLPSRLQKAISSSRPILEDVKRTACTLALLWSQTNHNKYLRHKSMHDPFRNERKKEDFLWFIIINYVTDFFFMVAFQGKLLVWYDWWSTGHGLELIKKSFCRDALSFIREEFWRCTDFICVYWEGFVERFPWYG